MAADADREIVSSRLIAVPRARVFAAWTDREPLHRWFGPKGFTNTFETFDARPGGEWRLVMRGPDGTNYNNLFVFVEIAPLERIVLDHVSPPKFLATATFDEQAGKTLLTYKMLFDTAKTCNGVRAIVVPANEQNFDRLEAVLAEATR